MCWFKMHIWKRKNYPYSHHFIIISLMYFVLNICNVIMLCYVLNIMDIILCIKYNRYNVIC